MGRNPTIGMFVGDAEIERRKRTTNNPNETRRQRPTMTERFKEKMRQDKEATDAINDRCDKPTNETPLPNYDTCPNCSNPLLEPDGVEFSVLHCSKCDWNIGITVREESR